METTERVLRPRSASVVEERLAWGDGVRPAGLPSARYAGRARDARYDEVHPYE